MGTMTLNYLYEFFNYIYTHKICMRNGTAFLHATDPMRTNCMLSVR